MTTTRPLQPWLHGTQIATHGNGTTLSDSGSFRSGAEGYYLDDRRVVSHLRVRVDGAEPTLMTAGSAGSQSWFLSALRELGDDLPDPTVELHQRRRLGPASLVEHISLVSRATSPLRGVLTVEIAGDGADIAVVKAGMQRGGHLPATTSPEGESADGLCWRDDRHRTTVTFDPAPATLIPSTSARPAHARFDVALERGQRLEVTMTVTVERTAASAFDADPGVDAVDWSGVRVSSRDPRLATLVETALEDLRSLLMRDPLDPRDVFAGAGTPWYLTLFGRDSIWAARMCLPVGTDLARGTLRALARRQGRVVDPETAQAPGKILHEVRRAAYVDPRNGMTLPPEYYGTIDATPLWICLLHDAWRWGLCESDLRDLLPALRGAVAWLTEHSAPDDAGLLRYIDATGHGLANQGWKDSGDSMRTASGDIAKAPIALIEAQAYAVEAAHSAAALLDGLGEPGGDHVRAWGQALSERVRERFWMTVDGAPCLAMALDGDGRRVDGVGSNMGHALGTGALTPDEAADVAATLTGPRLLGRLGIATLSHDNPAYNPIGYHTGSIWTHDTAICALGLAREGRADDAARVARTLVESGELFDYHWPELYGGESRHGRAVPYPASCHPQAWSAASAVAVLTAVLGLSADAPGRTLRLSPADASILGPFRVEGLHLGDRSFSVVVEGTGTVHVQGDLEGIDVVVAGQDEPVVATAAS